MKSEKKYFSLKYFLFPVFLAILLRYGPHFLYGNRRVYKEPIPYEVMDDFLTETNIEELKEWIFSERYTKFEISDKTLIDLMDCTIEI